MNRFIYNILCGLLVLMVVSCEDNGITSIPESTENSIILNFSTGEGNTSRAAGDYVEDTNVEFSVTHIDIFFFKDNDKTLFYYERVSIDNTTTSYGKFRLNKKRNEFSSTENYWVYVVANSTETEENITNTISELDDLKALQQSDENIHLTGHVNAENLVEGLGSIPSHFLMDGVAYLKPNSEGDFDVPSPEPLAGALNVNDGVAGNTTTLKVILHRAAAKIVVKIKPGDKITFDNSEYSSHAGYYLRNMPYSTTLLSGIENSFVQLRTSTETYSDFIRVEKDNNGKILYKELTLYVYSHTWLGESFYDKGTSLVINVPLLPEDEQNAPNNYYQIKLRDDAKADFERNKYYEVEVEVNAAGATVPERPIELPVLRYSTYDWTGVDVNVGSMVTPHYLKLNKDTVRIYNSDIDESLYFTSSHPVTVEILNKSSEPTPYFINKLGMNEYVNPKTTFKYKRNADGNFVDSDGNVIDFTIETNEEYVNNHPRSKMVEIISAMNCGWDKSATDGKITINSPSPENDAVRYYKIKVTNTMGDIAYAVVEQYPTIWITHTVGWYSYRDDFRRYTGLYNGSVSIENTKANSDYLKGDITTYEKGLNTNGSYKNFYYRNGNTIYYTICEWNAGNDVAGDGFWTYNWGYRSGRSWFKPRVRIGERDDNGTYNLYNYAWYFYDSSYWKIGTIETGLNNPRMYHIHVSTTSRDYVVGRPKMVLDSATGDKYTDDGDDNSQLVSPSFMLASQLGATSPFYISSYKSQEGLLAAKQHCARYVEVYQKSDGTTVHLNDWRLPTKKEIEFVVSQQYLQNAAMAEVLTGSYYMGANGPVKNKEYDTPDNDGSNDIYIRCVRDVY